MRIMERKIKVRWVIFLSAAVIIMYIIYTVVSIWNYGLTDEKRPADVAIVLGAATFDGEVSPVFQERLNHGIWLYENNYVEKLIFTGGIGEGNEYSDSYTAKRYAVGQGVPEGDILLEEESTITQENIEYAKKIMDNNLYHTALLVSDPLHMKRAMLLAEDYGIDVYCSPTPTTRYVSMKSKLPFLAREVFFYVGYKICRIFMPHR